ncbi:MAG TPA: response regulator [Parasulfuritortus sp.]
MRKKQILLVEDNPDDLELAQIALRESGFADDTRVARDGQEALDMLCGPLSDPAADCPDVVLLDLKLPRVNGFEVLKRLRQEARTRYLPVVVMSSSREEQDLLESYRLGANSYIQKSLDFPKFLEAVRLVGHYWLDLNVMPGRVGAH